MLRNSVTAALRDNSIAERSALNRISPVAAGGEDGRELMTLERERQRGKIEAFLAGLIRAAVVDGNVQRVFEPQDVRAAFAFTVLAEIVHHVRHDQQIAKKNVVGLFDGEGRVRVFYERRLLFDDRISRLVRRQAIMIGGAARGHDHQQQSREKVTLCKPFHSCTHQVNKTNDHSSQEFDFRDARLNSAFDCKLRRGRDFHRKMWSPLFNVFAMTRQKKRRAAKMEFQIGRGSGDIIRHD